MWPFAHLVALAHGLAAALVSISAFYLVGALALPRRWQSSLSWPDNIFLGLALYVVLCWVATTSREYPILYVSLIFAAALWGLIAIRFGWLQSALGEIQNRTAMREWLVTFGLIYGFAYLLAHPPANAALLPLPQEGALDLVTYARYAKQLLTFGTATVDLATFDYLRSPASTYVLAWHSLFFLNEPLEAAMPALFMMSALFGALAVDVGRSVFRLSWRAAMAIAMIAICAPVFRWALVTYSLGELLSATSVLYLGRLLGAAVIARSLPGSTLMLGLTAGGTLFFFSARSVVGSPASVGAGVLEAVRHFPFPALLGLPSRVLPAVEVSASIRPGLLAVLPLVFLVLAAGACTVRRNLVGQRIAKPDDRQLARALALYLAMAVIVGNVAAHMLRAPSRSGWPSGWRQLGTAGRMPFRTATLKMADEPHGLPTMLAMYYLPGRKAAVIGRGMSLDELPFETISRHQPMFIQNVSCAGAGHDDTVAVPGVGCVLIAPPSMTLGTTYPFNRTYLFIRYGRMTPREPAGRWSTEPTLNLRLTVDPERVARNREMFVNFLASPSGGNPLRLAFRWGDNRHGETVLGERQWVSLAVGSSDWSGNRLWNLPVSIDFSDGRTVLFHELALTESPRGVVAQPGQRPF